MSPYTTPIAPITSGAMRSLRASPVAMTVVTSEKIGARGRSDRAVVAAPRKADVELLELAIEVRAFEPGLFSHLAHVRLLTAQKLLEIDALECFARLAQRQLEKARGNLRGDRTIGRNRFAEQPLH